MLALSERQPASLSPRLVTEPNPGLLAQVNLLTAGCGEAKCSLHHRAPSKMSRAKLLFICSFELRVSLSIEDWVKVSVKVHKPGALTPG